MGGNPVPRGWAFTTLLSRPGPMLHWLAGDHASDTTTVTVRR